MDNSSSVFNRDNQQFHTTQWSMVLRAGRRDDVAAQTALAELCQRYWYPLYAFVRRKGHSPEEASDLTQAFFLTLIEKQDVAAANPERGRFRSFLLAAMNHFIANHWRTERTQKRGGGKIASLSLNFTMVKAGIPMSPPMPKREATPRSWDGFWQHWTQPDPRHVQLWPWLGVMFCAYIAIMAISFAFNDDVQSVLISIPIVIAPYAIMAIMWRVYRKWIWHKTWTICSLAISAAIIGFAIMYTWTHRKTVAHSVWGDTGFVEGPQGLQMGRPLMAKIGIPARQEAAANEIFRDYLKKYTSLERRHTTHTTDANGHVHITIEPFVEEMYELATELQRELSGIVDQRIAPPSPVKGKVHASLPIFRQAGEAQLIVELWKSSDGQYHWKQEAKWVKGGSTGFSSYGRDANIFPIEYRLYWNDGNASVTSSPNSADSHASEENGKQDRFQGNITLDLGNGEALKFVLIPAGSFEMGALPEEEADLADYLIETNQELPRHKVTFAKPFYLGKYEITQSQWLEVMGKAPKFRLTLEADNEPKKFGNHPIEDITLEDSVEFCKQLSNKVKRIIRLPSEAEWEYACRGGTTTYFFFGNQPQRKVVENLSEFVLKDYLQIDARGPYEIGKYQPNPWGLYDMLGNVAERVADTTHYHYENAPIDGSAWTAGGEADKTPVRGGSWENAGPIHCRSAARCDFISANFHSKTIGMRVVMEIEDRPMHNKLQSPKPKQH